MEIIWGENIEKMQTDKKIGITVTGGRKNQKK